MKLKRILLVATATLALPFIPYSQVVWKDVSAGIEHSIALKSDGSLWGWGGNDYGQVGTGSFSPQMLPVQIGTDTNWSQIECGGDFTLAIKNDGSLWAWGNNGTGQLGIGSTQIQDAPVQVGSDTDWKLVEAGPTHVLAIKNNGTLWSWGGNDRGQLGTGNQFKEISPYQVGSDSNWIKIAVGGKHSLTLNSDGALWGTGGNSSFQLGFSDTTIYDTSTFTLIDTDSTIIEIGAGYEYTLALKSDGTLWSWGNSNRGQLGQGNFGFQSTPRQIGTDSDWKQLFAGGMHAFALKENATLYGWGGNKKGQLGLDNLFNTSSPTQVGTDSSWVKIAPAEGTFYLAALDYLGEFSLAMHSDGQAICATGFNDVGQLGDSSTVDKSLFSCATGDVTASVKDVTEQLKLNVFPNPAHGTIHLEWNNETVVSIELVSIDGKSLFSNHLNRPGIRNVVINVYDYDSGIYFLKINYLGGTIARKVIFD